MKIGECVRLGVMRKVTVRIFEEKNCLRSYLSSKFFQCFFRIQYICTTNFHNFLVYFSCCPAELEFVGIFKISLSVVHVQRN